MANKKNRNPQAEAYGPPETEDNRPTNAMVECITFEYNPNFEHHVAKRRVLAFQTKHNERGNFHIFETDTSHAFSSNRTTMRMTAYRTREGLEQHRKKQDETTAPE